MEKSIYFKYVKLPSIEQIKNRLSLNTGFNIIIEKHQPTEYTDEQLVEFGISNEMFNDYKKNMTSYYLKVAEPLLVCFISIYLKEEEIEVMQVSYSKKYYFEGALLITLKELGGVPSEDLNLLVADYSYITYKEGQKNPSFLS